MATAQTVITEALVKLNVVPMGGAATANQLAFGLSTLNDLMRSWRRYGLPTWARRTVSFSLVAAQASYTLGPAGTGTTVRPTSILGAYVTDGDAVTELDAVGKADFLALSTPALTGTPTLYWYDPALGLATMHLWPVPDAVVTLTVDCSIPLTEMAAGDSLDIPDEWLEAVKFNLARRLGSGTGRKIPADLKELAQESFQDAANGPSGEAGSFRFGPDLGDG